ncbi:MAG: mechanosensitive ion channel protein MscS [Fimbriimonadales bacterium]|nr:MAG: mechanosensitive ion channel protein MscS [Fimbriimonadales bacterium]
METLRELWDYPVFRVGASALTVGAIVIIALSFLALYVVSFWLKRLVARRLLARTSLDLGAREAIGSLLRYFLLFWGTIVIIQSAGVDLTALHVLAGAIGVGVGFGLQNIANNFISGIIILFERPIKIGDRVEVAGIDGRVVAIGARATTVITNDNIAIIVPNSFFISEPVVNWTRNDPRVRFKIPVGVAYGSDLRLVEKLLLEAAQEHPEILKDPPPVARLMRFGDNAVEFELRVWSTTLVHQRGKLISDLNFAIFEKFQQHGIEIPFPQRDVHIRSVAPDRVPRGE